jgi:hypothetical protein
MKSSMVKMSSGSVAKLCCFMIVVCAAAVLTAGCHKGGTGSTAATQGIVPTDPQVVSNLDYLSVQLRRTLNRRGATMPANFDQFAEAAKITPPPPPPGQKYDIRNMRVILVDANAK